MGVPGFYRWLVGKYEIVVVDVIEEEPAIVCGDKMPVDTSKPNPNGEYDNFYLDMNGIIHPCFHPDDRPSPATFDEVFQSIFDYIDRLFAMVRPRKLLYMAIDGVAPRAKMNQQRSRRFRTAKDAAEAAAEEERLREEFELEGRKLPPKTESQILDSNVITPGTMFMSVLGIALQYYIHRKLNNDPGWKNIKVILSDSNVPGEGEHKIMSYIRLQRNLSGYDPNTRHCLYGLDADLIMLALATHEVHFSILREVVSFTIQDKCFVCGEVGHAAADCEANLVKCEGEGDGKHSIIVKKNPYQFLNIWTLREYLELEMSIPDLPFKIDLEHIVDDFVLMCFFAGNDFLPHMPTLDIREGAIDLLIAVYKKELRAMGGYLSNGSKLNLTSVEHFVKAVGSYEEKIFQKRAVLSQKRAERIRREKLQSLIEDSVAADEKNYFLPVKQSDLDAVILSDHQTSRGQDQLSTATSKMAELGIGCETLSRTQEMDNWKVLQSKLKETLRQKADVFNMDNPPVDKVRLGESRWKERYYEQKFGANSNEEIEDLRRNVVLKYIEGLCWIMHYYYEGVCSWHWFYPYHYAPFASDLKGIGKMKIIFELGQPFKPFNQLLGVFPAASAHALPEQYRKLMADPDSPIIDFYPADFEVDMDGKRYSWQGVAKLPFIDGDRLLAEVAKIEHMQTEEESRRNSVMSDMLFVSASHKLSLCIFTLADHCKKMTEGQVSERERIDPKASGGMNGYISLSEGDPCPSVFRSPIQGMHDIIDNRVVSAVYHHPEAHEHIPRPPEGVEFPEKIVNEDDIKTECTLWHEDSGRRPFDNGRNSDKARNALSRQHLGQSAKRLILNSVQIKEERNWRCSQIDSFHQPRPANTHSIYQVKTSSGSDPSFAQVSGHSQPGYAARSTGYRQPYSPPQVSIYEHGRFPNQIDNSGGKPVQRPVSQQFAYPDQRPAPPRAYMHPPPPQGSYAGAGHGYHTQYNQNVRLAAPLNAGRGFNNPQHDQGGVRLTPTVNAGRGFNNPQYNQGGVRLAPTVNAGRGFNNPQYNQGGVRLAAPNSGRGFSHPPAAPVNVGRGFNNPRSPGSSVWGRGAPTSPHGGEELQDKDDGWIKVTKRR